MTNSIATFVENHGLLAVFVLMALESCGFPIPSEVIMPVAGALSAGALGGHGTLNPVSATVAGTLGNLVGSLVAYGLAARWGKPLLLGPGRWIGISRAHVELADHWFKRRGLVLVFVGRMVPVIRTYISFPAGLARVELARFSGLTFVGALPWCAALTAAGYALGANWERVSGPIQIVAYVIAATLVAVVIWWIAKGRHLRRVR